MNTLHDLDNIEYLARLKRFRLEIECHGAPYHWTGQASSEGAATLAAMADLTGREPGFNRYKSRVTVCVEVPVGHTA